MEIREAKEAEIDILLAVHREAFGREDESLLVSKLMSDESAKPLLSLLAFEEEQPIGHILFTQARLEPDTDLSLYLLAPLAVTPRFQKKGVGGQLIEQGFKTLTERKADLVFVLGYPDYYTRYGFAPAGVRGFEATYPIPEKNADAWMVRELCPGAIDSCEGKVLCADALNQPEYWVE